MRRHVVEITSNVTVTDSDGNEIKSTVLTASVAVDIFGSKLGEIIQQTTSELAQDLDQEAMVTLTSRRDKLKKK